MRQGFTYIEVLVVIAIISVIVAISVPSLASFYVTNNYDVATAMLVSSLKKAQAAAMANKNDLAWGVCLYGRLVRLYGGSCNSPVIKDDYVLPAPVGISGLTDISFSRSRGEPDSPAVITLTAENKISVISLNRVGGLDVR